MTTPTQSIDCRSAMLQLYDYLDGELSEEKMQLIRQHLESCAPCFKHASFEQDLLAVLAAGWHSVAASSELRARIKDSLSIARHER
ncbi:MAG: zf-HC2 domain-containing protein [Gemmatimonadota bacterium]